MMDPVDVLTMAVTAAQVIRATSNPEPLLAGAYEFLGRQAPDDREDAMPVRIVRLMHEAGERRAGVLAFLRQNAHGPIFNRIGDWDASPDDGGLPIEPDPEAVRLARYVESAEAEGEGVSMFPDAMAPFNIAERSVVAYFGNEPIVTRDGRKLTLEEAGDLQPGDSLTSEPSDYPETVRGLIDYPLAGPVLFTIPVGEAPWSLWEIFCAFADQYQKIYENPERYSVWGHDMTDLWIEQLFYFPEEQLIYPFIGS